jgi:7,8-dihydropterin-6-yl-methyl-4-(beta-D-ribofuranosyl)aminobenzene 5'-phosphate synthase
VNGQPSRLTLFDTGPESKSLTRNIAAMKIPVDKIERVILSHWHSDHTGGLLSLLNLRKDGVSRSPKGIIVDAHPDRPVARGIAPGPNYDKVIAQLAPDPSFELIQEAGGILETHAEGHAVAGGTVWVSGEIPRVTEYEQGILGGMRFFDGQERGGKWATENVSVIHYYLVIR